MKNKYILPAMLAALSAGLAGFFYATGAPVKAGLFGFGLFLSLGLAGTMAIEASHPTPALWLYRTGVLLTDAVLLAMAIDNYRNKEYLGAALIGAFLAYEILAWLDVRIVKFILRGEALPRFYGIAWGSLHRPGAYCAPIPLNFPIGWVHAAWCYLKLRGVKMPVTVHQAYAEGLRAGHVVQEKHFN